MNKITEKSKQLTQYIFITICIILPAITFWIIGTDDFQLRVFPQKFLWIALTTNIICVLIIWVVLLWFNKIKSDSFGIVGSLLAAFFFILGFNELKSTLRIVMLIPIIVISLLSFYISGIIEDYLMNRKKNINQGEKWQ